MSTPVTADSALFDVQDQRRLAEAALRSIALSTSRVRGTDFFRVLVKDLAEAMQVHYVIVGELDKTDDGAEMHRTLAVWAGDGYMENISYDLANTPCRNVADQSMCFHPCNIQAIYPLDTLLVDMQADSYIGMPMVGTDGRTLGLLVALDTRPIDENKRLLALSLLSIFSARAAAELQHRRREEELELLVQRRTRALEEARDMLVQKEKLAALGHLVAGVAHVTNTPIGNALTTCSSVSALSEQLLAALEGERISRSVLQALATQIRTGCDLVEHNLQVTAEVIRNFRLLASSDRHAPERIRVCDFVAGVCVVLQEEVSSHHATVTTSIDPDLEVLLPPDWFSQILSQLIQNALRHGLKHRVHGMLHIAAHRDGAQSDTLCITVTDNGTGAPPNVLKRMFEPFFTTHMGQGGSGLGLHLVYTLVQRLGGSIEASSPATGGMVVQVHLPGCLQ